MLSVAESIVTRRTLAVEPSLGVPGRDGRIYSSWYPLQSFLAVPLVALAVPVSRALHVPMHFLAAVFANSLPSLFTAGTVSFVALLAWQLGAPLRGARRGALCFALGTIALVYPRTFYAEPLLALLVAAGLYFAFEQTPRSILGASACALLAVLAKPTGILVGPTLSLYLFAKRTFPVRLCLAPGLGATIGLLLYFAYNWVRFANPLTFGQPYAFSLSSVPAGVLGLLLSPGRGLLWYCPPIVMAIFALPRAMQGRRLEAFTIAGLFLLFLGLHSFWTMWSGGWSWGPRFLLPVIPGLMASTGLLQGRLKRNLVALSALGFLISAPTLVTYYERYFAEANEEHIAEDALLWSPERAPLVHLWGAAGRTISDASNNDVRELFRRAGAPSSTISGSRALRIVAVWWWMLPIVHIPRIVGVAVSFLLVSCGVWIAFRTRAPAEACPE